MSSDPLVPSATGSVYLAIDIGHDRLAAGVVNDFGEVLVRDRVATPTRDAWPALQRLVRRVVAARPEDSGMLRACGVTCEGPIDKELGTVSPLHIPILRDFAMRDRIHELTRLPTVLASSSQARVIAERWIGAARGVSDVMVLLLSDAVEAGIVSGGRLLGGRRGNAGQIGHLNVEVNGAPCICGAKGCLWAYASAMALQTEMNRPLRRAPGPVVERTGVMIGRAIASAAAVFDFRLVLLAGTVPTTFGGPLLEAASRELDQRSRIAFLRSMPDRSRPLVQLGVSTLGREAALVGAAGLGRLALRQAPRAPRSSHAPEQSREPAVGHAAGGAAAAPAVADCAHRGEAHRHAGLVAEASVPAVAQCRLRPLPDADELRRRRCDPHPRRHRGLPLVVPRVAEPDPVSTTPFRHDVFVEPASRFHARDLLSEPTTPRVVECHATETTLVLGSVQRNHVVDDEAVRRRAVEVTRRRSGGGAVLVVPDEMVWFDVVVPADHPRFADVAADVTMSMRWLGGHVLAALRALGVSGVDRARRPDGALRVVPAGVLRRHGARRDHARRAQARRHQSAPDAGRLPVPVRRAHDMVARSTRRAAGCSEAGVC